MPDTPSFYSCSNEFGADPCTFAKENRRIPAAEAVPDMNENGALKCPGKTLSGKDCGCRLHPLPPPPPPPWRIILSAAAGILVIGIWFFILQPRPVPVPSMQVTPDTLRFSPADDGTAKESILIRNQGKGNLLVEKISTSSSQFFSEKQHLEVAPGDSVRLAVVFDSSRGGAREGTLLLQTNDPSNKSVSIRLIAEGEAGEAEPEDPWWLLDYIEEISKKYRENNK